MYFNGYTSADNIVKPPEPSPEQFITRYARRIK